MKLEGTGRFAASTKPEGTFTVTSFEPVFSAAQPFVNSAGLRGLLRDNAADRVPQIIGELGGRAESRRRRRGGLR